MKCPEIPELIELDSYDGDYSKYEDAVYSAYELTFEKNTFFFDGKRIAHKKHPLYKDKSGTFWHIVSDGSDEQNRLPNLRRYERIKWPARILKYCKENCSKLLIWKNKRKGKNRILLWCQEIDYIVILDERDDFCLFWTAYPTIYKHTKDKLMKEYSEYIANKTTT